jgi:hypothetical protein
MSRRAAFISLSCALVGLGASAAAAYTHYHLLYDPAYRSFCDVSETISCTQVYLSRFSTVRGIPVALFGAVPGGTQGEPACPVDALALRTKSGCSRRIGARDMLKAGKPHGGSNSEGCPVEKHDPHVTLFDA